MTQHDSANFLKGSEYKILKRNQHVLTKLNLMRFDQGKLNMNRYL